MKNVSSSNMDDMIIIKKNLDTNEFDITYKDTNGGGSLVTHYVNGLYRRRVLNYLYMVFKNQSLDEEGYTSIQLTLPAMPRVLISGNKLTDLYYREHLLEVLGDSLDLLTNVTNKKVVPKEVYEDYDYYPATPVNNARPQHLFFD